MERITRRQVAIGSALAVVVAGVVGWTAAARGSDDARTVVEAPPSVAPSSSDAPVVSAIDVTERRSNPITGVPAPTTSVVRLATPSTTSPSAAVTTTTTTVAGLLLPTLSEGDTGPDVVTLQRLLNVVTGADLAADGVYGPGTTRAVANFQQFVGLVETGQADHDTWTMLTRLAEERTELLPSWSAPTIGNGGADGCQVAVVGDSLIAYSTSLHAAALREANCAAGVDAVGGRSLAWGWQCRILGDDGRTRLLLLAEAEPGNDTCAPSGLEVLELMRAAGALGDLVVIALGTNDAGIFAEHRWQQNWDRSVELADGRPMIFLTVKARPGSSRTADLDRYSALLRRWCDTQPRCSLADWALTPTANDAASYVDAVHLTRAATEARADFIRDAVLARFEGRPLPDPAPIPVVASTLPPSPTTTAPPTSTTPAPGTSTTSPVSTTSLASTTSTTTTTPTTSTTSTTVPTSTTTVATPPTVTSTIADGGGTP